MNQNRLSELVLGLMNSRYFSRPDCEMTSLNLLIWWERRRIVYNVIVGIVGLVTVLLIAAVDFVSSNLLNEPFGLPDPPIIAVFAILSYAIGANICYTGGWIVEILLKGIVKVDFPRFSKFALFYGTVFSVILTLLPATVIITILLERIWFQ